MKKKFLAITVGLLLVILIAGFFWILSDPSAGKVEYPLAETDRSFSLISEEKNLEDNINFSTSARVALVIDDLGWKTETISILKQVNVPVTLAILPGRPKSRELYRRLVDQFEVILHMPMEPKSFPKNDPGSESLFTSMTEQEIRETLTGVLERYPRVVGMNNHMGSEFVGYRKGMEVVMEILSDHNLFFLDSNTTPHSLAMDVASRFNVPAVKNNVFLDSRSDKDHIRGQFHKLIRKARNDGAAIGIGHIQNLNTAQVLRELIPIYQLRGVDFVNLSELVELPVLQYREPRGVGSYE